MVLRITVRLSNSVRILWDINSFKYWAFVRVNVKEVRDAFKSLVGSEPK